MSRTYETEMQPVQYLKQIICDCCGRPVCDDSLVQVDNVATISASWGYGSKFDTENHECDLCAKCYAAVKEFIENTLGGKVRVTGPFVDTYKHVDEDNEEEDIDALLSGESHVRRNHRKRSRSS